MIKSNGCAHGSVKWLIREMVTLLGVDTVSEAVGIKSPTVYKISNPFDEANGGASVPAEAVFALDLKCLEVAARSPVQELLDYQRAAGIFGHHADILHHLFRATAESGDVSRAFCEAMEDQVWEAHELETFARECDQAVTAYQNLAKVARNRLKALHAEKKA